MLNLDTHILIYALADQGLTPKEKRLLKNDTWSISSIVVWEIHKLISLERLELDLSERELDKLIKSLQVWPIDNDVCRASVKLDFKSDPADELIAATSLVHNLPLMTRDSKIRKSKMIKFAN